MSIEDEVREKLGLSELQFSAAKNQTLLASGDRDGDLVSQLLSKAEMDVCWNMGLNPTVYAAEKALGAEARFGTALMAADLTSGEQGVASSLAKAAVILMDSADVDASPAARSKVNQLEAELASLNETPASDPQGQRESRARIGVLIADTLAILRKEII